MYAELSDFFYVWLKRTAGHVFPELFRRKLTDKENEAVANPARFAGQPGARALAGGDYQQRMAAIFSECRRVLNAARERSVAAAAELLACAGLDREPRFVAALEAVLEVLPPSKTFTGIALEGAVEASGSDFEALYNLYRLAYDDRIDEPDQLRFWRVEA